MIQVVLVNRFFFPDYSATSQLLSDLAFHIASQGREVHVITSRQRCDDPGALLSTREVVRGVSVRRVWTSRFGRGSLPGRALDYLTFYLSAGWTLAMLARRGDIVVAKTDPPLLSLVAWPVARLKGAKLVNWLQDIYPEIAGAVGMRFAAGPIGRTLEWIRDRSLISADMNVVPGTAMEQYVGTRGVPAERVTVIPNWADGDSIRPVSAGANELRRSWGLESRFVVGYSGNMGRVHEFETILQSAAELRGHKNIVFLFIGYGAQWSWIEQRAAALGLRSLQFRPFQPRESLAQSLSTPDVHLVSLLPAAEGLVFPSKLYGVLAAGRPVIFVGPGNGEIARLVNEQRIGGAVECGNASGLAALIRDLAGNPDRVREMGARAARLFDERYSAQIALKRWSELLNRVSH